MPSGGRATRPRRRRSRPSRSGTTSWGRRRWRFWMAVKVAAYLQEQERRRGPAAAERASRFTPRPADPTAPPLPKPRGPDPEEEERKVVEGLLQAGDLDGAIEACGPMAVRVWL